MPAGQDELRLVRGLAVLKAEANCHVDYCNGVGQVFGVRLVERPPPGVTADAAARVLRCHGARAVLGALDRVTLSNDPYWLPDSWVDIDVRERSGDLLVTLTGNTVSDNIRILHRATAFAAEQRAAVP